MLNDNRHPCKDQVSRYLLAGPRDTANESRYDGLQWNDGSWWYDG
ncbi:hypothetical protein [Wolbachia endosymbiont of Aedes albopictus]|nr:hypothetical protein [Wolbachia endosymbiont of Aedes albopictus]